MLTILSIEKLVDPTDSLTGKTAIEFKIDNNNSDVTLDAFICTNQKIESFEDAEIAVQTYLTFISIFERW